MFLAAHASAQTYLYGVRSNGDLVNINLATGAASIQASSGAPASAASSYSYDHGRGGYVEWVLTAGQPGAHANDVLALSRFTGVGSTFSTFTGLPAGYTVRAMTTPWSASLTVHALLQPDNPAASSLLASLAFSAGTCTVIGPTGRTDLTSIAEREGGPLFALGTDSGGVLYTLSGTGQAVAIGGGGFGGDDQALELMPDGRLLACGQNLRSVDPATGATTLIGPTGFTDIRDLTWIWVCFADCSHGGPPPILNVQDFGCYLYFFALGVPQANCDLSTAPPVLNVNDFNVLINSFWSGASSHVNALGVWPDSR
jgi:hypothetical protein